MSRHFSSKTVRANRTKAGLTESFLRMQQKIQEYMRMSDHLIYTEFRKVFPGDTVPVARCPKCGRSLRIEDGKFPKHNDGTCLKSGQPCNEVVHHKHVIDAEFNIINDCPVEQARAELWRHLSLRCREQLLQSALHYEMLVLDLE